MKNNSSAAIYDIRYKLSTATSWGSNRLATGETIAGGGGEKTFSNIAPGKYDFAALNTTPRLYTKMGLDITAGSSTTITINDSDFNTGFLDVCNSSGKTVAEVYFVPSTQSSWGENLLFSGVQILNGKCRQFGAFPVGTYKIKVVATDNEYASSSSVAINADRTTTITLYSLTSTQKPLEGNPLDDTAIEIHVEPLQIYMDMKDLDFFR